MLDAIRSKDKKGPGGILGGILGGGIIGGGGQKQQVQALVKHLKSTAMRCGAVFKKQKTLDAKVEAIAKKLNIKLDPQDIKVDIGEGEIAYFENFIKELEDDGAEDVGVLTKMTAMKNLLSLFKKMSRNVGAAAEVCQRTENTVIEIEKHLRDENIKEEGHPEDDP